MLTVARLAEITDWSEPDNAGLELNEYIEALSINDRSNLIALSELKSPRELDLMAEEAKAQNPAAELFIRVAAVVRRSSDALKHAATTGNPPDLEAIEPATKYELPVIGLTGPDAPKDAYAAVAGMLKGAGLRLTKTSGWAVLAKRPSENVYIGEDVVAWLAERRLIVAALGIAPGSYITEYNLSAIGWRTAGILYTDKTADVENRVYELLDTPKDNPIAARYRGIIADWRARQARKDTTPTWARWCEFEVSLSAKATGHEPASVTVIFESGRPDQPDAFDFFGPVKDKYQQFTQPPGATPGKSVYDRACDLAAEFVRAAFVEPARVQKPARAPKPELKMVEDDEDAEELALSLGIM